MLTANIFQVQQPIIEYPEQLSPILEGQMPSLFDQEILLLMDDPS